MLDCPDRFFVSLLIILLLVKLACKKFPSFNFPTGIGSIESVLKLHCEITKLCPLEILILF